MSIDEQIAILQAYKEGKTIVCSNKEHPILGFETDIKRGGSHYSFNFADIEYSVKPEPREFWIVIPEAGDQTIYSDEGAANLLFSTLSSRGISTKIIHVREVTGE